VIALVVITALIGALIGASLLAPTYESKTTLRVTTADYGAERVSYDAVMYSGRLTNTYSKVVTSDSVVSEMRDRLGLTEPIRVTVDVPANTELMQITVTGRDPFVAADAANALAEILIDRVSAMSAERVAAATGALGQQLADLEAELLQPPSAAQSSPSSGSSPEATAAAAVLQLKQARYARLLDQYDQLLTAESARGNTVTVLERAAAPLTPSRPQLPLILLIALGMGLVGGIGLAFLFEHLDTRLHTTQRIQEVTDLRILGTVPVASRHRRNGLFNVDSPECEALRRVRTHLQSLCPDAPRTLLVTSAEPGEGKSAVVANLAAVLAEAGRTVIVVDGDLRRPTLHRIFGLPNVVGLSSILTQETTWDQTIQESNLPNVWVIASGPTPPNPAELLGAPPMAQLFECLVDRFDAVLVDTPSLLAVSDAAVLAQGVDGVILVVSRARAHQDAVQAAQSELIEVGAKTLGVIVNRAEPDRRHLYYRRSPTPQQGIRRGQHGDA